MEKVCCDASSSSFLSLKRRIYIYFLRLEVGKAYVKVNKKKRM